MSNVNSNAYGAALPEKDDIKPEDSVSNVSGATTTASKTPSLKSRLRFTKRNDELRAFKKKMQMELTLADIGVEEKQATQLQKRPAHNQRLKRLNEIEDESERNWLFIRLLWNLS